LIKVVDEEPSDKESEKVKRAERNARSLIIEYLSDSFLVCYVGILVPES